MSIAKMLSACDEMNRLQLDGPEVTERIMYFRTQLAETSIPSLSFISRAIRSSPHSG